MDDRTLERRLKAKDKLIAELVEALEKIASNLAPVGGASYTIAVKAMSLTGKKRKEIR